jgi:hypothetical protein
VYCYQKQERPLLWLLMALRLQMALLLLMAYHKWFYAMAMLIFDIVYNNMTLIEAIAAQEGREAVTLNNI